MSQVNWEMKAWQAWNSLIECAAERGTMTYSQLGESIGVIPINVRLALSPIQDHCMENGLPPLTVLCVGLHTGLPGDGFIAWASSDLSSVQREVWDFPWKTKTNPFSFAKDGGTIEDLGVKLAQKPEVAEVIYRLVPTRDYCQQVFRSSLMIAYGFKCAFSDITVPGLLQAAHILPWKDCLTPAERMDPRNGILLAGPYHQLFDLDWIRVTPDMRCERGKMYNSFYEVTRLDQIMLAKPFLHGLSLPERSMLRPNPEYIIRRNQIFDSR